MPGGMILPVRTLLAGARVCVDHGESRLLDVRQRLCEQLENVVIVDRVVDQPPGAARPDEAHAAQQPQLVGDGRFADANERGNVADAELAGRQGIEDAHARRIAEHAERVGERFDRSRRSSARLAAAAASSAARRRSDAERMTGAVL